MGLGATDEHYEEGIAEYPEGSVPPLGHLVPGEEQETPSVREMLRDTILLGHRIAAGLLAHAGVIDVEEARQMAGLPAFTTRDRAKIRALLRWTETRGRVIPLAWYKLWDASL
ncbi:MAG: hypothetical protein GWN58_02820 [Anaerolineae bacterium]|nr:hypothetical protein [Anaerolineae bacterium]